MAYSYQNLDAYQNTGSGIAEVLYLAPVADIETIQCPAAPFAAPGDEVKVKTAHVMKSTKKFIKALLAPEKNQYNANTIGDKGFQKFSHEVAVFFPGSYAEVHEFAKNIINTPLIAIIPDADCDSNLHYQLGCDCLFAYLTMNFSTGTTIDGVKGYTGTITYQSKSVLIYVPDPEDLLTPAV